MLLMSTLYDRLLEICLDQGVKKPIGRDIQRVAGLSSGRVTQIKDEREAAKLGSKTIQRLTALGYLVDWLQDGRGPKRPPESAPPPPPAPAPPPAEPSISALLARLRAELATQPEAVKRAIAELVSNYLTTPDEADGRAVADAILRTLGARA